MIRHGSSYSMAEVLASRSAPRRVPIPELTRVQGMVASKSNVVCNPAPRETTLTQQEAVPPEPHRLAARTIPKPLYP